MHNVFNQCSSLTSLPDISKWNTKNVINMFNKCISLSSIPDIKWNSEHNLYIDLMFDECFSILNIPENFKKNESNRIIKDSSYLINSNNL